MLPRYHPHFAGNRRAFSDADTSKTCNVVTRPSLLPVSGGSSWEKARHCTQAAHTIPLSLYVVNPIQGSPIFAFHISKNILAYSEKICKLFFNEITVGEGHRPSRQQKR